MKKIQTTQKSLDEERAARLARIDTTTLGEPELELIELYRAMTAPMRGALLTIARMAKGNDRPEGR